MKFNKENIKHYVKSYLWSGCALASWYVAFVMVNLRCGGAQYDEKVPEAAKKLRRF